MGIMTMSQVADRTHFLVEPSQFCLQTQTHKPMLVKRLTGGLHEARGDAALAVRAQDRQRGDVPVRDLRVLLPVRGSLLCVYMVSLGETDRVSQQGGRLPALFIHPRGSPLDPDHHHHDTLRESYTRTHILAST